MGVDDLALEAVWPVGGSRGAGPVLCAETWQKPLIGADPGLSGGLALVWADGTAQVWDIPVQTQTVNKGRRNRIDVAALAKLIDALACFDPAAAIIEQVHGRPGVHALGAGVLCHSAGVLEGILTAKGVPVHKAPPHVWKRAMGVGKDAPESSREAAMKLAPAIREKFARIRDDGRADALLLAVYGIRVLGVTAITAAIN